jgi:hypothetical protein
VWRDTGVGGMKVGFGAGGRPGGRRLYTLAPPKSRWGAMPPPGHRL